MKKEGMNEWINEHKYRWRSSSLSVVGVRRRSFGPSCIRRRRPSFVDVVRRPSSATCFFCLKLLFGGWNQLQAIAFDAYIWLSGGILPWVTRNVVAWSKHFDINIWSQCRTWNFGTIYVYIYIYIYICIYIYVYSYIITKMIIANIYFVYPIW